MYGVHAYVQLTLQYTKLTCKPESQPKSLSKMSRNELISNLQSFRNAWEQITTRNQDLDNKRLAGETTEELRNLLKFYYSDAAKNLAISWLQK